MNDKAKLISNLLKSYTPLGDFKKAMVNEESVYTLTINHSPSIIVCSPISTPAVWPSSLLRCGWQRAAFCRCV